MVALTAPPRTDADLVDELVRGGTEALEEIYQRHGDAVLGLATRILRDRSLAEDVVQDLLVRLWIEPHRFDARRGSLRTFLMTSASSRSIDMLRAESSRREREQRRVRLRVSNADDLERDVVDKLVAEELRDALQHLSDDERRALTLAYFGGHSYREVARLLGQPEGTVKSRIQTGMRRLATMLRATAVD
jgi:RNA polymerase sigma-70 factor (ECF subfamily)